MSHALLLGRIRRVAPWLAVVSLLLAGCDRVRVPPLTQPPPQAVKVTPPPVAPPPPPPPAAPAGEPVIYSAEEAKAQRRAPPAPPPPPETTRIGLLLPLTGQASAIGASMLDASQLALFEASGAAVELLTFDTRTQPKIAERGARALIAEGSAVILGPLLARSVNAAAPAAQAAGIPMIAFSNDSRVAGNGVFIVGFTPESEVERIVSYAAAQGKTRVAVLAPDDDYGVKVIAAARQATETAGGTLVAVQSFGAKTTDFAEVVRQLAGKVGGVTPPRGDELSAVLSPPPPLVPLKIDALLIADSGERLLALAGQLAAHGLGPNRLQILGTGAWDTPGLGAQPALVGAWFAAPPPAGRRRFEDRYRAVYGRPPERLATLAYDATALAAVFAREARGRRLTQAQITDANGFIGRDGLFRFRADGLPERQLTVLQVERYGSRVIDEPRAGFGGS
jgi:ABC-type branched-subunit amino acid transport system substrate-binding protein